MTTVAKRLDVFVEGDCGGGPLAVTGDGGCAPDPIRSVNDVLAVSFNALTMLGLAKAPRWVFNGICIGLS